MRWRREAVKAGLFCLLLALAGVLLTGSCRKRDDTPATPVVAVASDTSVVPESAPASSPEAPMVIAVDAQAREAVTTTDPDAVRVTNIRVSFDAQSSPGVVPRVSAFGRAADRGVAQATYQNQSGFRALYAYFLREHAAAVVEAVNTVDHGKLLAARDEFESDAAHEKRIQEWLRTVKLIFQQHVGSTDYEVFGLQAPTAAVYDATAQGWMVPFPTLPEISDMLGESYIGELLAGDPDVQARLRSSLPLVVPNIYLHPLRSEWSAEEKARTLDLHQGQLFLRMPDQNRAREFKERLQAGRVFYSLRFTPEMKLDWWGGPSGVRNADFAVLLRPTAIALYSTDPSELLSTFTTDGSTPPDLWFLTPEHVQAGGR